MSTKRVLQRVLSGTSDASIGFDDLLQREGHEAKPYQVKQVRALILRYGLEGGDE
jgi:hypothetical protein